MLPLIIGMFLLGVYAAKNGLHLNIGGRLPFFRKLRVISGVIGLPLNTLYIYSLEMSGSTVSPLTMLGLVGALIGGPAMCLFYMSSIILLSRSKRIGAAMRRLQPVGIMSLTNYLMQSIICTLIFYSYGFGLFGKIGPAEWLWRTLTYGKTQPMRAEQSARGSAAAEA